MPSVLILPEAEQEHRMLPPREQAAIDTAYAKLLGAQLPFPHQSAIRGAQDLRELRPRAGRSPWRALYRQVKLGVFVVAAISPEAESNPKGFTRAVAVAQARLDSLDTDESL